MANSTLESKPKLKARSSDQSSAKGAKSLTPTTTTTRNDGTATTERQWQLLTQLERTRWQGAKQLQEKLTVSGHKVSLRTVQRDLNALAKRFPIEKTDTYPQGWRWKEDAPIQSLPHITLSQAVAFNMVEANLAQLLPPSILDELFPWFNMAKQQLQDSKVTQTWVDKVRIEPATQPLIAPKIDRLCKDGIYEALFYQKQIIATYQRRGRSSHQTYNKDNATPKSSSKSPFEYHLNPLAVVQRGVVIYLLATKIHDPEQIIRTFALHRFKSVSVTDEPAVIPDSFDLNQYLDAGGMGFAHPLFKNLPKRGKKTQIKLVFNGSAGTNLNESRLSTDQIITQDTDNDTQTVTATVNLTSQLVWWLRGFGKKLTVIEPEILAKAVHQDDSANST